MIVKLRSVLSPLWCEAVLSEILRQESFDRLEGRLRCVGAASVIIISNPLRSRVTCPALGELRRGSGVVVAIRLYRPVEVVASPQLTRWVLTAARPCNSKANGACMPSPKAGAAGFWR